MKRVLQLVVFGLGTIVWLPNQLTAQISLTAKDYPFELGSDSLSIDENGAAISLPKGGADMKWDYSKLTQSLAFVDQVLDGTKHSAFDGATHKQREAYTVQAFRFRAMNFEKVDENGYSEVGRIQFDSSHSLLTVTGNAADEMHFPYYEQKFTHPRNKIKFPYTYQDGWEEMDIQLTKFNLTVAAFGLNKTPGEVVRRRYQKREVIGYGELTLPDGSGGKSRPMQVLLVHIKDSIIDSVFLAGSPAPAPLLAAFKFTQGDTWHYESYAFEMKGLGRQPLGLILKENGEVSYAYYRPRATRLGVSTDERIAKEEGSIYPSQVKAGQTVRVASSLNQLNKARLIATDGSIHALQSRALNSYLVPDVAPGVYMLQVFDTEVRKQFTERIVVVE